MLPDEVPDDLLELFQDMVRGTTNSRVVREALAAVLTVHQQAVQGKVAVMIEDVVGGYPDNHYTRPRVERGRHLNDWQWAAHLARWGYPRG